MTYRQRPGDLPYPPALYSTRPTSSNSEGLNATKKRERPDTHPGESSDAKRSREEKLGSYTHHGYKLASTSSLQGNINSLLTMLDQGESNRKHHVSVKQNSNLQSNLGNDGNILIALPARSEGFSRMFHGQQNSNMIPQPKDTMCFMTVPIPKKLQDEGYGTDFTQMITLEGNVRYPHISSSGHKILKPKLEDDESMKCTSTSHMSCEESKQISFSTAVQSKGKEENVCQSLQPGTSAI